MTCLLVTPWWRHRQPGEDLEAVDGGAEPTPILDWDHPLVRSLAARVTPSRDPVARLRAAHRLVTDAVRPVYAVDDAQPISRTLRRGRGSCSQRMAVLEGVARAHGIATRVRGLVVDGRFWYPRFPRVPFLVPAGVLLAWPEFRVAGEWLAVDALFGAPADLAAGGGSGFTNAGGETLFDAVARTAVDWDGLTCSPGVPSACDLSATVLTDLGRFATRDELFARHGQTLCGPLTTLADPVLSRWAPPAVAAR
ncbi:MULTISPECIES: transglutaminase domain-containing protein [Saccharothrix]|uniref:transglutaminase domain-containing protein n=1 Tax=Saccharothrix TaxID=2071 RepID=UPI000A47E0CA|nr:transglutaminase domain-containing protein [Saccharothrix sp. CB00851]